MSDASDETEAARKVQSIQRGRAARGEVKEHRRTKRADVANLTSSEAELAAEAANRLLKGGSLAGVSAESVQDALEQRESCLTASFAALAEGSVPRDDAELQLTQEVEATTLVVTIVAELRARDGGALLRELDSPETLLYVLAAIARIACDGTLVLGESAPLALAVGALSCAVLHALLELTEKQLLTQEERIAIEEGVISEKNSATTTSAASAARARKAKLRKERSIGAHIVDGSALPLDGLQAALHALMAPCDAPEAVPPPGSSRSAAAAHAAAIVVRVAQGEDGGDELLVCWREMLSSRVEALRLTAGLSVE
eukprot:5429529-Prymnesium_polylepis.1